MSQAPELSPHDAAMLAGEHGEAARLAMRIVVQSARVLGAAQLLDITSAHIDGCLYHGQASLDFAERLVAGGGRVAVPTTLNVGSLDLLHPRLFRGDPATAGQARRLMDAYVALGCPPTWTCAPYQLPQRPGFGRADRLGRVERDRLRQLGARRADEPLRRLHRHLRRASPGACPMSGCTATRADAGKSSSPWRACRSGCCTRTSATRCWAT